MKKQFTLFILFFITTVSFAQDRIYTREDKVIKCTITDELEEVIYYKPTEDPDARTQELPFSKIEMIKYGNGKTRQFEAPAKETTSEKSKDEFDRNDPKFVDYANSLAKLVGTQILKKCTRGADNSTSEVYFDSVFKDLYSGEIHIPIRIIWDGGLANETKWIKGIIMISKEGKKTWQFQNSEKVMFAGCAKVFKFEN